MDIDIDDKILERMIAEVRALSPEEALQRLESHRERSIGMHIHSLLHFAERDTYVASTKPASVIDWNTLDFDFESPVVLRVLDEDAANDDNYAMAA